MCGIFGYFGKKENAGEIVFHGLRRLDYRGYDSWGIGMLDGDSIVVTKQAGKIPQTITSLPTSSIAIGHTRWATHGGVTKNNAHPHFATDHSFILAQNGIVENYQSLKQKLQKKGYAFSTETDTEVIVRLIEDKNKRANNFIDAVRTAFHDLTGRNTIVLLTKDGTVIGARNGSPLVLGIGKSKGELFLSSDILSFAPYVEKTVVLENQQIVEITNNKFRIISINTGKQEKYRTEKNTISNTRVDKDGFDHFMLKEIYESPFVIEQIYNQDARMLKQLALKIKHAKHVYAIGSGTAGAAAAQIAYYLRIYGSMHAVSLIGAEASDYYHLFTKDDVIIAPSQSGETADVLEALEHARSKKTKIASLVNMPGSMITRMSDYPFMSMAGPEICVMSTKIFVSQIAWGYLLAKTVQGNYSEGKRNLQSLARVMSDYLHSKNVLTQIKSLADRLKQSKHIFLLGKAQNLQIVKEGMVKLVEGSYIHAHALPAGDLKHYAITLMEPGVSVIVVISNDEVKEDVLNAVNEVNARGASVIGISPANHERFTFHLQVSDLGETSAILTILPLQLLAYYLAVALGNNVDKPRNIAKSVTVK
ncbi:glutamine--fructose-6-phosphate transaminase (isomerizing) [Candidatus Roizmanbacteria bacterium]|nr:glutamine--fructose-6-phosphate transaminase (isomerizing) [Candidatus Roizmanbacteria bacterium]